MQFRQVFPVDHIVRLRLRGSGQQGPGLVEPRLLEGDQPEVGVGRRHTGCRRGGNAHLFRSQALIIHDLRPAIRADGASRPARAIPRTRAKSDIIKTPRPSAVAGGDYWCPLRFARNQNYTHHLHHIRRTSKSSTTPTNRFEILKRLKTSPFSPDHKPLHPPPDTSTMKLTPKICSLSHASPPPLLPPLPLPPPPLPSPFTPPAPSR